jgi:hypothetical protein
MAYELRAFLFEAVAVPAAVRASALTHNSRHKSEILIRAETLHYRVVTFHSRPKSKQHHCYDSVHAVKVATITLTRIMSSNSYIPSLPDLRPFLPSDRQTNNPVP